jgi:hypothetical protein
MDMRCRFPLPRAEMSRRLFSPREPFTSTHDVPHAETDAGAAICSGNNSLDRTDNFCSFEVSGALREAREVRLG